jgi:hypothetical protein
MAADCGERAPWCPHAVPLTFPNVTHNKTRVGHGRPHGLSADAYRLAERRAQWLSVTGALGLAMPTPAPSIAADGATASSTAPPGYWLCYSRLAGYKWFQFSNCTGKSYKYTY